MKSIIWLEERLVFVLNVAACLHLLPGGKEPISWRSIQKCPHLTLQTSFINIGWSLAKYCAVQQEESIATFLHWTYAVCETVILAQHTADLDTLWHMHGSSLLHTCGNQSGNSWYTQWPLQNNHNYNIHWCYKFIFLVKATHTPGDNLCCNSWKFVLWCTCRYSCVWLSAADIKVVHTRRWTMSRGVRSYPFCNLQW